MFCGKKFYAPFLQHFSTSLIILHTFQEKNIWFYPLPSSKFPPAMGKTSHKQGSNLILRISINTPISSSQIFIHHFRPRKISKGLFTLHFSNQTLNLRLHTSQQRFLPLHRLPPKRTGTISPWTDIRRKERPIFLANSRLEPIMHLY